MQRKQSKMPCTLLSLSAPVDAPPACRVPERVKVPLAERAVQRSCLHIAKRAQPVQQHQVLQHRMRAALPASRDTQHAACQRTRRARLYAMQQLGRTNRCPKRCRNQSASLPASHPRPFGCGSAPHWSCFPRRLRRRAPCACARRRSSDGAVSAPDVRKRAPQRSALVDVREQRVVHDVGGHEQVVAAQLGGYQVAQRGRSDIQQVIINLT
jgi:hypothetical protein